MKISMTAVALATLLIRGIKLRSDGFGPILSFDLFESDELWNSNVTFWTMVDEQNTLEVETPQAIHNFSLEVEHSASEIIIQTWQREQQETKQSRMDNRRKGTMMQPEEGVSTTTTTTAAAPPPPIVNGESSTNHNNIEVLSQILNEYTEGKIDEKKAIAALSRGLPSDAFREVLGTMNPYMEQQELFDAFVSTLHT